MGDLDDSYDRSSRLNRSLGVGQTEPESQMSEQPQPTAGTEPEERDYGHFLAESERFRYLCLAVGNTVDFLLEKGKKKEASEMAGRLHSTYPCAESKALLNKCLFAD